MAAQPDLSDIPLVGLRRVNEQWVSRTDTISVSTYKQMLDDAGILFPLSFIKLPILRTNWAIQCESAEIAQFVHSVLNSFWNLFLEEILTALEFGFAPFVTRWEEKGGYWVYRRPVLIEQERVLLREEKGNFAGFRITTPKIQNIPAERAIWFTYNRYRGNLYGRSILRSAYKYYYVDKFLYEWQLHAYQRNLVGTWEGWYPKGVTRTTDSQGNEIEIPNQEVMYRALESLRNNSIIVHPFDPTGAWGFRDVPINLEGLRLITDDHRHLDNMKAKAIFVPDRLAGTAEGGTYNLAEVQSRWLDQVINGIVDSLIKNHLDKYFIPPLVKYNFGEDAPPATWEYEPIEAGHRMFLAEVFLNVMKSPTFNPAMLDLREISARTGIPLESEFLQELKRAKEKTRVARRKARVPPGGITSPDEEERTEEIEEEKETKPIRLTTNLPAHEQVDRTEEGIQKVMDFYNRWYPSIRDKYVRDVEKALSVGNMAQVNAVSVSGVGAYKNAIRNIYLEFFHEGAKSITSGVTLESDLRMKQWLLGCATSLAQKHLDDLNWEAWQRVLKDIYAGVETGQMLENLRQVFDDYFTLRMPEAARWMVMEAMELGRNYAEREVLPKEWQEFLSPKQIEWLERNKRRNETYQDTLMRYKGARREIKRRLISDYEQRLPRKYKS